MSLILEALRKLDREKQTPERGLVVTGASDWARPEQRRGARLALVLVAGLALGAGAWLWRGRTPHAPATPAGDAAPAGHAPGGAPEPDSLLLTRRLPADASMPAGSGTTSAAPAAGGTAGDATLGGEAGLRAPRVPTGTAHDDARRGSPTPVASQPSGVALAETPGSGDAQPATRGDDTGTSGRPESAAADPARGPAATPAPAVADQPAAPGDEVVLQAVTERDGQPLAIVNGRLVREGDSFDGIRILRIHPSEIEVEVRGRRRTIGF